jgi:cellulose synthase/poly-beta-1,6-N-acetylglucosamine synthase-like glycosyltransferase
VQVLRLPANFQRVIVPPGQPQTKPKALNFALQLARGSLVAVYDAEDRPEPNQLRQAVAAFAAGPPELACVQAPLGFYNAGQNWLTCQLAIEYASLFDAQLPALAVLRLPIPLGGTSNHFRRDLLEEVGAWDPYNVTEDADLGIRLARHGYRCAMLSSHTYEEACGRFPAWLRQRTRWIKGWLQTYFVHMRAPLRLWRELGTTGFLAFNVLIAGTAVSALAHPIFSAVILYQLATGIIFADPASAAGLWLVALNAFNLTVGYMAAILLGWIGVRRRGLKRLVGALKWMPVYWLLISLAGYRAIWELVRRPFHWDKTEHTATRFRLRP